MSEVYRVCIYGAGGVGGYLAARLSEKGVDVTVIARGEHLSAIRVSISCQPKLNSFTARLQFRTLRISPFLEHNSHMFTCHRIDQVAVLTNLLSCLVGHRRRGCC